MQEHVDPIREPPHLELVQTLIQICSDTPTLVRGGTGIAMPHEFTTPLLDKGASKDVHQTQEKAKEHDDIHANDDGWRLEGLGVSDWGK